MKKQKITVHKKLLHNHHVHRVLHLSPNSQTGKILPTTHTSFGALCLLLVLLIPQLIIYRGVQGVQTSSGSIPITATVPGPAPTTPATISSPTTGITTTSATIIVSGTCGADLLVRIYRNDIFAGSTYCSASGTFTIEVSLATGKNDLRALNYDTLDQAGPTSPTVSVTYTPKTTTTTTTSNNKLPVETNILFEIDYHLRQLEPNQSAGWEAKITYGRPSYTLVVQWGDKTTETKQITDNNSFKLNHTYQNAGKYVITFSVQDADGNKTRLQIAVTVNGTASTPPLVTTTSKDCSTATTGAAAAGCSITKPQKEYLIPFFWILLIVMGVLWFASEIRHRRREHHQPHVTWQ